MTILVMLGFNWPALSQTQVPPSHLTSLIHASDLLKLAELSVSTGELTDSYRHISRLVFAGSDFDATDLLAFEENRFFAYAVGDASKMMGAPRRVRRFIFLKPSTFVVDDEVQGSGSGQTLGWLLYSHNKPEIAGRQAHITEREGDLFCQALLPNKARLQGVRWPRGKEQAEEYALKVLPRGNPAGIRCLQVLQARRQGDQSSVARAELVTQSDRPLLTIATAQRIFRLTLPMVQADAGDIAISTSDGKELLVRRPLPAGVLPHGPEGIKMLDLWDDSYRGGKRPSWDAGRPSGELQKVVDEGLVRACRAVDLGCGSGTDAIYLASHGFDVTAIDIAPTALRQAEEKARQAGVKVRWLLADVLALPKLEPFDFIFDRGCYHEVRIYNARAYVETVRRLSHAGTRFLLLAGNPNELPLQYAPPQVAEEEIRSDFSLLFDFEWIRETRFETINPSISGPLAWSVMLRRKGN